MTPSPQALAKAKKEMAGCRMQSGAAKCWVDWDDAVHTLALAYDRMSEAARGVENLSWSMADAKWGAGFVAARNRAATILAPFILPDEPDPLVEVLKSIEGRTWFGFEAASKRIRAELARRGLEIRKRGE